jgi:cytochrome oxidase Cu insertion factor (SCO1/SenC/PrrC family)
MNILGRTTWTGPGVVFGRKIWRLGNRSSKTTPDPVRRIAAGRLLWGCLAISSFVLCGCAPRVAVVEYESEDGSVRQAGEVPPRPIVDFALTDSENAEFNSQDLRGQVWVVSFFFSKCPSICRQQNEIARRLWREFRAQDVAFVSITCDPEEDTPERLKEYAKLYEANPEEWMFLTGDMDRISQIGEESFQLGVGYRTHSDRFVAVDKWGRVRGIYDWHDSRQLDALKEKLEALVGEDSLPDDAVPVTPPEGSAQAGAWLREFTLTASSGDEFSSQQLQGDIWVASFFYTTCPTTCRAQNDAVGRLYREFSGQGVKFVCISCDPETDTPERLADYAKLYQADSERWVFLTGELDHIRQIASERFGVPLDRRTHVDRLIVVDQQGAIQGKFNWHDANEIERLKKLLNRLTAAPAGLSFKFHGGGGRA